MVIQCSGTATRLLKISLIPEEEPGVRISSSLRSLCHFCRRFGRLTAGSDAYTTHAATTNIETWQRAIRVDIGLPGKLLNYPNTLLDQNPLCEVHSIVCMSTAEKVDTVLL